MLIRRPPPPAAIRLLAGLVLVAQGGCMSALTSAALREAVLDSLAHHAATGPAREAALSSSLATDRVPTDETAATVAPPEILSLEEAIDRAVSRLQGAGEIDPETQATLLALLEDTNPEDWPAAIDAFTASLVSRRPARSPAEKTNQLAVVAVAAPEPRVEDPLEFPDHSVNEAGLETEVVEPRTEASAELMLLPPVADQSHREAPGLLSITAPTFPILPDATEIDAQPVDSIDLVVEPPIGSVETPLGAEDPAPAAEPQPASIPPAAAPSAALTVRRPCFATRVRAWGVVDRFKEAVFRPGQDVIVYFELDAPASLESADGHGTSIDTVFRLVTPDGREVGHWNFEPINETCHASRHDYFARYILRIPDTAPPGHCRLEFVVTDLIAGISTPAHLDLEIR